MDQTTVDESDASDASLRRAIVMHELRFYSLTRLQYLEQLALFPLEFLAWITRTLLEVNILVRYVAASDGNFINYQKSDELDGVHILESMAFNLIVDPAATPEFIEDYRRRIRRIEKYICNTKPTVFVCRISGV